MKSEAIIRADFLSEEREKLIREKVRHEIDIDILEQVDEEAVLEVIVEKDKGGKEVERQVKVKDVLKQHREAKGSKEVRLQSVNKFLKPEMAEDKKDKK